MDLIGASELIDLMPQRSNNPLLPGHALLSAQCLRGLRQHGQTMRHAMLPEMRAADNTGSSLLGPAAFSIAYFSIAY
jgi:hypothetical protein